MKPSRLLLPAIICTVLCAVIWLPGAIRLLPALDANVRAAVAASPTELRKQGVWLLNAKLNRIRNTDDKICVDWKHQYRGGSVTLDSKIITVCPHE